MRPYTSSNTKGQIASGFGPTLYSPNYDSDINDTLKVSQDFPHDFGYSARQEIAGPERFDGQKEGNSDPLEYRLASSMAAKVLLHNSPLSPSYLLLTWAKSG